MFYVGAIGAALGYTMQTTIAAWLMATLSTSAVDGGARADGERLRRRSLFGLVGGAMADIVDRRKVILATQVVLIVDHVAASASLTLAGWVGPATLLALTFVDRRRRSRSTSRRSRRASTTS